MSEVVSYARSLTDRIKAELAVVADHRDAALDLIREAKDSAAHEALGYASWPAYVTAEFSGVLPRLTGDERRPIVAELSAMGMSTRAIAPIVGASDETVRRDILSGATNVAPEPKAAGAGEAAASAPTAVDPAPVETPIRVTGLDGKTYRRSEPIDLEAFAESGVDRERSKLAALFARGLAKADDLLRIPADAAAELDDQLLDDLDVLVGQFVDYGNRVRKARKSRLAVVREIR